MFRSDDGKTLYPGEDYNVTYTDGRITRIDYLEPGAEYWEEYFYAADGSLSHVKAPTRVRRTSLYDHIREHAALGLDLGVGLTEFTRRESPTITFVGDSTVDAGEQFRFSSYVWEIRSNAAALTEGDATIVFYADGTAKWASPGDSFGEPIDITAGGLILMPSYTQSKEATAYIPPNWATFFPSFPVQFTLTLEQFAQFGYLATAPHVWGQILSGYQLKQRAQQGAPNERTSETAGRLTFAMHADSFGRETENHSPVVFVSAGIRDLTNPADGWAIQDTLDNYTAMRDTIVRSGAYAVFCTVAYETPDPTLFGQIQILNAHLRTLAEQNDKTRIADIFVAVRDGDYSDGRARAGLMSGDSFTSAGAFVGGQEVARVIREITGRTVGRSRSRFGGDSENLVTNGAFLGTAGALSGGVTGSSAWDVTKTGTVAVAASKETVTGECPWQVFTASAAGEGDTILASSPVPGVIPGETVSADIEFDVSAATGLAGINLRLKCSDGGSNTEYLNACGGSYTGALPSAAFSGLLRTPEANVMPWVTEVTLEVVATFVAGGSAVIKVRNAAVN